MVERTVLIGGLSVYTSSKKNIAHEYVMELYE